MTFLKNFTLLLLFAALLFSSCRKDEEINGSFPSIPETPEVFVNGSLSGTVVDANNEYVQNAVVTFLNESKTTDENGFFIFKNVEINTKGSLVTIEKEGYFFNAKFVESTLNEQTFTTVKLLEKELTGSFTTETGGTIETEEGAKIEFSPNSIQKENGETYTGDVKVYAAWLDPTSDDLFQEMPGDLRGYNLDEEERLASTYGIVAVELEGENGEKLNISEGNTAKIEFPVPAELAATAPTTLSLSHMNEETGYWQEEGMAELQNGKYVGTVSHFSFWNCNIPNQFVYIQGTVTDLVGNPIPGIQVIITEISSLASRRDFTNNDGIYAGTVPADLDLIITVTDNCGATVFSAPLGSFLTETTLPVIAVDIVDEFMTISGILVDCDNNPVVNGYLKVDAGTNSVLLTVNDNGEVSGLVNICEQETLDFTGYDFDNEKQSLTSTLTVPADMTVDLDTVNICDEFTEFFIFTVGDDVQAIEPFPYVYYGSVNEIPDMLQIYGQGQDVGTAPNPPSFRLTINEPAVGTPIVYSAQTFYYIDQDLNGLGCSEFFECNVVVEITTYEGLGGYAVGSFSGILDPLGSLGISQQEVSGSFRVMIVE